MAEEATAYKPLEFVDTSTLSEKEWLAYRREGIGGSDAAAVLGISPFRTARDLYYDKLNIASVEEDEGNWVALKMGHLLEDLVAEIFHRKTGFKIYQVKKMFQHPLHPYMLADVDYFIELPNGSTAILEIKTTNYNAKNAWFRDGVDIIPPYYEAQGRHYMAVMDVDEVYFCCLYGNTEDEVIIRHITRDRTYEEELVALEGYFWKEHVLAHVPPPYTEDGGVVAASARRYIGVADTPSSMMELRGEQKMRFAQYIALQERKRATDGDSKSMEEELKRLRAILVAGMGQNSAAHCTVDGVGYDLTCTPVRKPEINKGNLQRLKLLHPDIYEEFVTVSEYRKLNVKQTKAEAA